MDLGHALLIRVFLGVEQLESDHSNARGDATPGDLFPSVAEQCLGIAGIRDINAPHVGALGSPGPLLAVPLLFLDGISGTPFHVYRSPNWSPHTFQPLLQPLRLIYSQAPE
ncbi:hypothetical protein DPMN_114537 [Dreissena polymorpha]|uniref:Uncharacterized protein n=1 Tax=Dreissena polymorpha TaxID=45954 RepID=A0A9D4QSX9_DREPO|nr:hypothetical protein DPMN_114537 [Dreissena polymorpha]